MVDVLLLNSIEQTDYLGVPVTHAVFFKAADTVTLATLITQMQAYQQLYDPLTGAQLNKNTVRITIPLTSGLKAAPAAGDENEMTALFNFSQTGSVYKNAIDIPGIASLMVVNGKVDLTNAGIQAWVAWLEAAHSGIQAVSKFVLTLVALLDALLSFRKHRKAETRRSLEAGE